ncbi:PREDICTED: uncharacterized protein LOC106888396 [Calidris pugnax]|uniref:uncharacterized protein LOC106888396 n=1 Tax=Calidris pugnax TaxID=198806 RepID=UPI00071E5695|nr:PREDICTED: uncharacterized protein LOC106888396 [Calidris pugnax]
MRWLFLLRQVPAQAGLGGRSCPAPDTVCTLPTSPVPRASVTNSPSQALLGATDVGAPREHQSIVSRAHAAEKEQNLRQPVSSKEFQLDDCIRGRKLGTRSTEDIKADLLQSNQHLQTVPSRVLDPPAICRGDQAVSSETALGAAHCVRVTLPALGELLSSSSSCSPFVRRVTWHGAVLANEDSAVTTDAETLLGFFILTEAKGPQEPGRIFTAEGKTNLVWVV